MVALSKPPNAIEAQRASYPLRMQRSVGHCQVTTKSHQGRTALDDLRQEGASKVMFPRRDNSDWFEAVLVNTSGGLAGGDRFEVAFSGGADTKTVLTNQACEKNYRALGEAASLKIRLQLLPGAELFWCPQETILFNGSRIERSIRVDMDTNSSLVMLETVLFGRAASDEIFKQGSLSDQWRIHMDGRLVHAEALQVDINSAQRLQQAARLGRHTAMSTIIVINPPAGFEARPIQRLSSQLEHGALAASSWSVGDAKKIVVRALARNGYAMRQLLDTVFKTLPFPRPLPRVWRV